MFQVESFSLSIPEKGTVVKEVVEVDVDNQIEVIRVPQHNNVVAMDMMNDFKVVSLKFMLGKKRINVRTNERTNEKNERRNEKKEKKTGQII